MVLPPGTLLTHLYVADRLRRSPPGRFVEVGTGSGTLSRLLLRLGWAGLGVDLNPEAVEETRRLNADAIAAGRYDAIVHDWLAEPPPGRVDLVISTMVVEHLDEKSEAAYFARCSECARKAIVLVPGSPAHWGIEDEIAGHHRRYTAHGLGARIEQLGWHVDHLAGLTFPLTNLTLPLSNRLVRRAETQKLQLPVDERTRLSGVRDVPGKTTFPAAAGLLLNERTMYPWHLAQKAFRRSRRALVIYAEASI